MLTFHREVEVEEAAPGVYDYLADFSTTNEWDPRASSTTRIDGDGGEESRYRCDVSFLGRSIAMVYTTTRLDEGERIEWVGESPLVRAHDVIRLRPTAHGLVVDYTFQVRFVRAPRLLEATMGRPLRRLCDDAQEGLGSTLAERFGPAVPGGDR